MNVPRLTVGDLHTVVTKLPPEMREDPAGRVIGVTNAVIAHFLGREWFEAHIRHDARCRGFLNLDFSSDQRREASTFRVIELGENLFNLQHVEGFDACISQMCGGPEKIDSTCAELDFGRFLYIHDIDFRFVVPQLVKSGDYDFEVTYPDGLKVPAEAKCKFQTTAINPDSLRNSLKKARGQLPSERPGIIFVKVPQRWIETPEIVTAMVATASDFMKTTGRVVSVKYYVSQLSIAAGMVMHRHGLKELTSRNSRFNDGRNWDLFADFHVPSEWNGMPPKWQRLFCWPLTLPDPQ